MMVDNSIVVLDSCFRATAEKGRRASAWLFFSSASRNRHCHQLDHRFDDHDLCRIPAAGILKQYDRTDVQAAGIYDRVLYVGVPAFCDDGGSLCYLFYKPSEAKRALMGRPIERLQKWYRGIMDRLLLTRRWLWDFRF